MYWFTGIIWAESWLKFFPGLGFAGSAHSRSSFYYGYFLDRLRPSEKIFTYRLLYVCPLFLIIFFLATAIKEINYDDVTALFFICAAWFLFTGLTRESTFHAISVRRVFISLNTFSRLPEYHGSGFDLRHLVFRIPEPATRSRRIIIRVPGFYIWALV